MLVSQPAKGQQRRAYILLGQVLQAGREASNCLQCQYGVVVDRVERMARLMELEKSLVFVGWEGSN